MSKYILSIDAGTTGITVLLFDRNANIVTSEYCEITQFYPKPGWVEHDPNEIWEVTFSLICKILSKYKATEIQSIGIANQRETTVIWNKDTNEPIYNAIVWQCRRTENICNEFRNAGFEKTILKKTGLVIDSYFSATKIKWIIQNTIQKAKNKNIKNLRFGTIDTWLIWKLTNGQQHVTDHTNASRTMLYNLKSKQWDSELLELFNIPPTLLPNIINSSYKSNVLETTLFDNPISINGIVGDQQAALFGQAAFDAGTSKCTYGTGCFLLTNTGDKIIYSKHGLLTTVACDQNGDPCYALEGSVFSGGSIIQWLRDELNIIDQASDSEAIAKSIDNTKGVYLVPAFTGLGAPYWKMDAKAMIIGLTRGTGRKEIIRAALESIAFQVHDLLRAIQDDLNKTILNLKVDGGAAKNNFLMQFQSDILNIKIERPINIETTAFGAALLAGLGSGFWNDIHEISKIRKIDRLFKPNISELLRKDHISNWENALSSIL